MEEKDLTLAKETFAALCRKLDSDGWHYRKEDDLTISLGVNGEDMPIDLKMQVDAKRMLVSLTSEMPFTVPEDRRIDMGLAITTVNYKMSNGCFDLNIGTGKVSFRMATYFKNCVLGPEAFDLLIGLSIGIINRYNVRLAMLATGVLPLDKFLEKEMA